MEFHPTAPGLTHPALIANLYRELDAQDQAGKMTIVSCLKALHGDAHAGIAGTDDFQKLRALVQSGMVSQDETQQKLAKKISDLVVDSPVFSEVEKEERTVFLRASSRSIGHLFTWAGELGRRFHNYLRYGYGASQDMQRALAGAATEVFREVIDQRTSTEEFTKAFTSRYELKTQGIPGAKKFLNAFLKSITSDPGLVEGGREGERADSPTSPQLESRFFPAVGSQKEPVQAKTPSSSPIQESSFLDAADEALARTISLGKRGEEFIDTLTRFYKEKTGNIPGAQEFLDTFLMTIMSNASVFEEDFPYTQPKSIQLAAAASAQRFYTPPKPAGPEPEPLPEPDFEAIIPSGGAELFDDIEQIVIRTKERTPPSLAPPDYGDRSPEKLAREEAQSKVDENAPEDPNWRAKTIYSNLRRLRGTHYATFSKEFSSLTNAELKYLVRYSLAALQFPATRDFATAKTILEEYNRTVIKATHSEAYLAFAQEELMELLDECSVGEKEEEKLADLYRAIGGSDSFPE